MRENFLEGVWLEGGKGKEMVWVRPIKKFSPPLRGENEAPSGTKMTLCKCTGFVHVQMHFFFARTYVNVLNDK